MSIPRLLVRHSHEVPRDEDDGATSDGGQCFARTIPWMKIISREVWNFVENGKEKFAENLQFARLR